MPNAHTSCRCQRRYCPCGCCTGLTHQTWISDRSRGSHPGRQIIGSNNYLCLRLHNPSTTFRTAFQLRFLDYTAFQHSFALGCSAYPFPLPTNDSVPQDGTPRSHGREEATALCPPVYTFFTAVLQIRTIFIKDSRKRRERERE